MAKAKQQQYDNSSIESLFATMKKEWIYRREYKSVDDVKKDVFDYIEMFYNRKRFLLSAI